GDLLRVVGDRVRLRYALPLRLRVPRAARLAGRARDARVVHERARPAAGDDRLAPPGLPLGDGGRGRGAEAPRHRPGIAALRPGGRTALLPRGGRGPEAAVLCADEDACQRAVVRDLHLVPPVATLADVVRRLAG